MTAPDPFPDINPFSNDNIRFAKNLADILVPSGRDRPRPEQQVVSLSEYNALLGEFEHMKGTADEALARCRFLLAERDAAYTMITHLRDKHHDSQPRSELIATLNQYLNNELDEKGWVANLDEGTAYPK